MDKIAVIGLSCLFPEAETPETFWRNLREGRDSRSPARDEKMGVPVDAYYDPRKGRADRFYCMLGGFVRDFKPDPKGFGIPAERVAASDDSVKWSLYVAREALKDSGYWGNADALGRCGVILGNLSFPTKSSNRIFLPMYHQTVESCLRQLLDLPGFRLVPFAPPGAPTNDHGRISGYPAAAVAEALGLSGASFALDAACASSLYAVRLACEYLLAGKSDMMLAGAVSAADPLFIHIGFSIFQAYPEEGRTSAPLDADSGGLVAGEGAGMFVLKRYSDAVRDGDRIHSVILGIGWSNDGRGQSVLSPNTKGQILAFQRAYADAGIDPTAVQFVECHATGTPLGDQVELRSMDAFFGEHGAAPLVGSVKSNVGHLLTAAGMASMTKAILSLAHEEIPGTLHVRKPQISPRGVVTAERIPLKCVPWPDGVSPKRAGVSGFGFGGTNAHLILEKLAEGPVGRPEEDARAPVALRPRGPEPMAVVGMEVHFGGCEGVGAFYRTLYHGTQHFRALPAERWKGVEEESSLLRLHGLETGQAPEGAYLERFDLDFLRFRIPPNEEDRLIPQQLLVLKVGDRALQATSVKPGENVAVIIAMETELAIHQMRGRVNLCTQFEASFAGEEVGLSEEQKIELEGLAKSSVHDVARVNQYTSFIGNIMASRIAALWDFSGPAFTVSAEESSVFRALEIAQLLLSKGDVDAVLVGAVDLAGGLESLLWRSGAGPVQTGRTTLGFDRDVKGWLVGEGAGAVVLRRVKDAEESGELVYATLDAVSLSAGVSSGAVAKACREAFREAGVEPERIGYVEASASGLRGQDEVEWGGLAEAYGPRGTAGRACAIGSAKANIGHTFAASGMAGLIKAVLCLYHRFIPTTPGWSGLRRSLKGTASPFYVPCESGTWFLEEGQSRRVAAVSGLGSDGTSAHVVLSEPACRERRAGGLLEESPPFLIPLPFEDPAHLRKELEALRQELLLGPSLPETAGRRYTLSRERPPAPYGLAIVGRDRDEILQEIRDAEQGVRTAFETGKDWATLRGSCLTAKPLGGGAKVAFVYPGGYASYVGMGRDLFQLFPALHEQVGAYTSRLGEMAAERLLYPRSLERISAKELRRREGELLDNPVAMFESGILFAIAFTRVVRDCFRVQPQMAFGYSMGEVSMRYALGVWGETDKMSRQLRASPLFRTRLAGPMETVREAWGLPAAGERKERIWHAYALRASPAEVREAIGDERRVHLLFINSPTEVLIAGEDRSCNRVIRRLGCEPVAVRLGDALHCELARADYDELVRVHTLDVKSVSGIDFYSAYRFDPIPVRTEAIAENIASLYCREIDFPELVRRVHGQGARVFIELGARENCTNWITEILKGEPHVAVSLDRKGADGKTSILRALSRLFSHRVSLDLGPLYPRSEEPASGGKSLIQSTLVGGTRIPEAILEQENRKRFRRTNAQGQARDAKAATRLPSLPAFVTGVGEGPGRPPGVPVAAGMEGGSLRRAGGNSSSPPSASTTWPPGKEPASLTSLHAAFLEARAVGMRELGEMIRLQMSLADGGIRAGRAATAEVGQATPAVLPPPPAQQGPRSAEGTLTLEELLRRYPPRGKGPRDRIKPQGEIFDYWDLREFAEGRIGNVFGERYGIIDSYRRRVRLPLEPYLLVSRVTKLKAQTGVFNPCSMTTEYDIPRNAWYSIDGQIPWAVAVESGQCDLWLISYLGIDFECKGERVYRLLDCTLTFLENVPREGDTLRYDIRIHGFARTGGALLFFFEYDCYVEERRILEMRGGCAGFFTDEELRAGKGILHTAQETEDKAKIRKKTFEPLLHCRKTRFDKSDLVALARGAKQDCFGPAYDPGGANPALHLAAEPMLMLDRIVSVDPTGGAWGLGLVVAEKDLAPDHWYFPCHFKDDQVLAGSLMAEGCSQLMRFYMLYLGLQTRTRDGVFQPLRGLPQKVRCRGQVIPEHSLLTYRMEVKEIGTGPGPYAIADIDVLLGEKIVVDFKDLGVSLAERDGKGERIPAGSGKVRPGACGRQAGVPAPLFDKAHLEAFATGSIAGCFGPDFSIYEGRKPPRTPNGDLQLISRVLEVKGTRLDFKKPAGVVTEYDVPEEAWFFRQNAHPAVMPYSILMEIALQPNGFISAWMATTLTAPDVDFCFRNLDGEGTLLRPIDLRGRTVSNHSELVSTVTTGSTIIQQFRWELRHEEEPFYRGTAVFGYFLPAALTNQIGLDGGKANSPLRTRQYLSGVPVVHIDLKSRAARDRFFMQRTERPWYRLAGPQLEFLDEVHIVEEGGRHNRGYICGTKKIDPSDWFYPCHFYQDPVMPGSLGVESILQAMQVFALQQDLGGAFRSPMFCQRLHHRILWKYRGQLIPTDDRMVIEVHIKSVEHEPERVSIIGDASLWKNDIRIYEVTDAAICLEEAG
jgi:PfaB family protein